MVELDLKEMLNDNAMLFIYENELEFWNWKNYKIYGQTQEIN